MTESEDASHQWKSKKMKHTKTESSLSSKVFGEQQNYHTTSDSSDDNLYVKKEEIQALWGNLWGIQKDKTANL